MTFRNFLALAMAVFLSFSCLSARPTVLGVVMAAARVHLNTTAVTAGATVYDGDRFSTEAGGMLRLQIGTAGLELAEESAVSLQSPPSGAQRINVNLHKGRLVFSSDRVASLNVIAREVSIRPVADTRTVAQICVRGPKELHICARRGTVQFSYRGETETIPEGKTYRVILDPSDGPKETKPLPPLRRRKAFLIIDIGVTAAVIARVIYELIESPDRP